MQTNNASPVCTELFLTGQMQPKVPMQNLLNAVQEFEPRFNMVRSQPSRADAHEALPELRVENWVA